MIIILAVFWALPRIDFRVGSNAVVIEWMGYALRRIPLSDINRVSKRLKGKPEVWRNTLRGITGCWCFTAKAAGDQS